jgi:hypothetical protein
VRAFVRACLLCVCFRVFEIGLWFVQEMTALQDNRQLPPPITQTPTVPDKFRMNQRARTRAFSVFVSIAES